ncbi:MAG: hypothetical protein N3G22_03990 [Candidatus Micrarchaeota archaeon]|nr:hypothetical protein [Candidatus Micrarchaeota archaeon]
MKEKPSYAAQLSAIVIILSALFAYFLFYQKSPEAPGSREIQIFLSPGEFIEGSPVRAEIFSSCGDFEVFLDGHKIASGKSQKEVQIEAQAGEHLLVAKSEGCKAERGFVVLQRQCRENENRSCMVGRCPGFQTCQQGRLSPCILPQKVCVPGEKRGCTINACQFGKMECNECGTGFGPCLPHQDSYEANAIVCPQAGQ